MQNTMTKIDGDTLTAIVEAHLNESLAPDKQARATQISSTMGAAKPGQMNGQAELMVTFDVVDKVK